MLFNFFKQFLLSKIDVKEYPAKASWVNQGVHRTEEIRKNTHNEYIIMNGYHQKLVLFKRFRISVSKVSRGVDQDFDNHSTVPNKQAGVQIVEWVGKSWKFDKQEGLNKRRGGGKFGNPYVKMRYNFALYMHTIEFS